MGLTVELCNRSYHKAKGNVNSTLDVVHYYIIGLMIEQCCTYNTDLDVGAHRNAK